MHKLRVGITHVCMYVPMYTCMYVCTLFRGFYAIIQNSFHCFYHFRDYEAPYALAGYDRTTHKNSASRDHAT
jgi:hypothetical protein